ncbi:hypothetical protein FRC17_003240 [Serendipita sp. 399]|nr:hypothetical protein FRC17_003240 [Serendipita sp. 399]
MSRMKRMSVSVNRRIRGGSLAWMMWRDGAIYFALIFASELACVIISAIWGFQKTMIIKFAVWALQNVTIAHMTLNLVEAVRRPETTELLGTSFFNPSNRDLHAVTVTTPTRASMSMYNTNNSRRSRRSFGGGGMESPVRFESGHSSPVTTLYSKGTLAQPYPHETSRTRLTPAGGTTPPKTKSHKLHGGSGSGGGPTIVMTNDGLPMLSPFHFEDGGDDASPFRSNLEMPPLPSGTAASSSLQPFLLYATNNNRGGDDHPSPSSLASSFSSRWQSHGGASGSSNYGSSPGKGKRVSKTDGEVEWLEMQRVGLPAFGARTELEAEADADVGDSASTWSTAYRSRAGTQEDVNQPYHGKGKGRAEGYSYEGGERTR